MIGMAHRIVTFCGHHAARIRISYLFSFLKAICNNVPVITAIVLIDRLIRREADVMTCVVSALVLAFFLGLGAVLQNLANRFQSATGYKVFAEKRMAFGEHLRTLPMGFFTEGNIGRISAILSQDMVFIEELSMGVIADVVSDSFSQLVLTVFLFVLHPYLGLIAAVTGGVAILIGHFMIRSDHASSLDRQESIEDLTDAVIEYADGLAVTKSFNRTGDSASELRGSFTNMTRANLGYEFKHMPYQRGQQIIYGAGITGILATSVLLLEQEALPAARFIGVMLFVFNAFAHLKHLYELDTRFTIMNTALDRIESVFAEKPLAEATAKDTAQVTQTVQPDAPEIAFHDVSFSYEGDAEKEVLHGISFTAERGQMIALIGQSGSGKTTIANLLARFWDVTSGQILVRGTDIRDMPMSALMEQISMVFQKVYLFRDTVFHNIAMGKEGATLSEVEAAAKKAGCYDFIMKLPYGFDTVIGEGGASLSGGEAQRISIARCILKDTPIIILDEATASIDADNEKLIQEAMTELCRDKTTIVIAHRLNTIRNADRIILIEDGRIVDSGNHVALSERCEAYRRMVALQNTNGWAKRPDKALSA